eukprot:GHVP01025870.1.p1 GENE.GHVP01025870.1~~GHVP01025870.1.p1  ORF type:complete len:228 (+),score=17.23 GHVP01025870.1:48-731(+)
MSTCQICQYSYSSTNKFLIPRITKCGHSMCTRCLAFVLSKESPNCPFCRTPLESKDPDAYTCLSHLEAIVREENIQVESQDDSFFKSQGNIKEMCLFSVQKVFLLLKFLDSRPLLKKKIRKRKWVEVCNISLMIPLVLFRLVCWLSCFVGNSWWTLPRIQKLQILVASQTLFLAFVGIYINVASSRHMLWIFKKITHFLKASNLAFSFSSLKNENTFLSCTFVLIRY